MSLYEVKTLRRLTILTPEGGAGEISGPPDDSADPLVILPVCDRWHDLFDDERAALTTRHQGRKNAYASARKCAHLALQESGHQPTAIGRSEGGVPIWPQNVYGSLTHSEGLSAACVAIGANSVGIDIEHTHRMTLTVAERIATPQELALTSGRPVEEQLFRATLLFSAKEAVYKAIHPMAANYIGYQEVTLQIDDEAQRFTAQYLGSDSTNSPINSGRGYYWQVDGAVLTKFNLEIN